MTHRFKDIAVFFDTSETGLRVLDRAVSLASAQQGHLIALTSARPDESVPAASFARGNAIQEVIRRSSASAAARLLKAGQSLARIAAEHGVDDVEFRIIAPTESAGETTLHTLHCDLLVIGEHAPPGAPASWSLDHVLERVGVPVLILPDGWSGSGVGQRITVAWNASRQARRAVADAMPLLVGAQEVHLLIVDAHRQDADVHGEEPGADTAAYLARHGARVELQRIESHGLPIAEAIKEQALRNQADLLVFGAYSRSRMREAVFGGTTRTLLSGTPLPLFVSH